MKGYSQNKEVAMLQERVTEEKKLPKQKTMKWNLLEREHFEFWEEPRIVAQWVKPPTATPVFHIRAPVQVLILSIPIQLPANT